MGQTGMRSPSAGANQQGVRNHNERLLMSLIQRHGTVPGSDLARMAGLSSQTVSVILRQLEEEGLIGRGEVVRGKVGKPSVPMGLHPDGVYSFGLKIGRRSADLLLVDFKGQVRGEVRTTYRYPLPETIIAFLRNGITTLTQDMTVQARSRIAGIGIARPFQLWDWHESLGAQADELEAWRDFDFSWAVAEFSDLPVHEQNDATAACRAEHVYGRGSAYRDFAYFFVGAFIGGGLVINHSVFEGPRGNAGAFGSLPARRADGGDCQLIDAASLYLLERDMVAAGLQPSQLWIATNDWAGFPDLLDRWITLAGAAIARAALTVCAVIDVEAVLIDGGFPSDVRDRLVAEVRQALRALDSRGVTEFEVESGSVGGDARALGAACGPVFLRYLLNTHSAP